MIHSTGSTKVTLRPSCHVYPTLDLPTSNALYPSSVTHLYADDQLYRALEVHQLPNQLRKALLRKTPPLKPRTLTLPVLHAAAIFPLQNLYGNYVGATPSTHYDGYKEGFWDFLWNEEGDELLEIGQEILSCSVTHRQFVMGKVRVASFRKKLALMWDREIINLGEFGRTIVGAALLATQIGGI